MVELIERPLPKPSSLGYASARVLEALVEAGLALRFLEMGLTRNAAGKAFQAWRAVLAALLRIELDRLKAAAQSEEEKRRLEGKAVPRLPTTKMISLSQRLRELGYGDVSGLTAIALNLHDYQYHGPDPDMALSKYRTREEAAAAVVEMVEAVLKHAEALRMRVAWGEEHEKAARELKERLATIYAERRQ